MKQTKLLLFSLLMSILTGSVAYWAAVRPQKKIAVVDAVKLFDSYDMKKELEQMAKVKLQSESKQLDSVRNVLQMAKVSAKSEDEVKKIAYEYGYLKTKV